MGLRVGMFRCFERFRGFALLPVLWVGVWDCEFELGIVGLSLGVGDVFA